MLEIVDLTARSDRRWGTQSLTSDIRATVMDLRSSAQDGGGGVATMIGGGIKVKKKKKKKKKKKFSLL